MHAPSLRAQVACISFGIIAIAGWLFTHSGDTWSYALAGYYALLLLNTFFSIKVFTRITPPNIFQDRIDLVLAALYCILGCSFFSVALFCTVSSALFIIALMKYTHARTIVSAPILLYRKIRLNAGAAILCAAAATIAAYGYPAAAAWTLFISFAIANVYLLGVTNMYRLTDEE